MKTDKLYSFFSGFYDFVFLKLLGYEKAANYNVEQLPFRKNDVIKVLDAGCGTGLYTVAILKRFPCAVVTAIDINERMLQQLKRKLNKHWNYREVKVFNEDISSPVYLSGKAFDLIIAAGVLEHLNIINTVEKLSHNLKQNGYFLYSGVRNNLIGKAIGTFWKFKPYSRQRLKKSFANVGFHLVKAIRLPGKYFIVRLAKEAHLFKLIVH